MIMLDTQQTKQKILEFIESIKNMKWITEIRKDLKVAILFIIIH